MPPVLPPLLACQPEEDTDTNQGDFDRDVQDRFACVPLHGRIRPAHVTIEFGDVGLWHLANATTQAPGCTDRSKGVESSDGSAQPNDWGARKNASREDPDIPGACGSQHAR